MLRPLLLTLVAVAALTLTAAACGGGEETDDNGGDGGPSATAPATTPAEDNGEDGGAVSFDISLKDNLFEPKEFTVNEGAEVTFNITNEGSAVHNMRVAGVDNEFNTNDDEVSDQIIAAGAESSVTWTAPVDSGAYGFQCDYHLPDMAGTITVK